MNEAVPIKLAPGVDWRDPQPPAAAPDLQAEVARLTQANAELGAECEIALDNLQQVRGELRAEREKVRAAELTAESLRGRAIELAGRNDLIQRRLDRLETAFATVALRFAEAEAEIIELLDSRSAELARQEARRECGGRFERP